MPQSRAIVQVIGSFQGGGAQRLALNLAEAIAAQGGERRSVAIALRHAGAFAEAQRPIGVEVHALNASRASKASVLRAAWQLRGLLRRINAGVVHVHGSGCVVVTALATLGWRDRPRLVFTWHDSGSVLGGRGLSTRLTRWALRRCDALYGSSKSVADRLHEALGPRHPVGVLVNGVPERPLTQAIEADAARVLWMGRLVPVKDPELMLRALARVKGELRPTEDATTPFECVLAGAALPHAAAFERQCRDLHASLGLNGAVSMPGWVGDTAGLLASSNIGVQSSRSEGLSMALLEQMMAGLAIVATDVGDTLRAIEHERTGLLVPPGDEAALGDALTRVVRDADLRRRLGHAARERALREFSLEAMAGQALEAYKSAGYIQ
ncbi:MAG: glycosyltransferase family 4 protein [Phycisphaerales bacterium]